MKNLDENIHSKLQSVMNDRGLRTHYFMIKNLPYLSRVQHIDLTTFIHILGIFLMERHIIRMIMFLVIQNYGPQGY